ncbi:MAG: HNH endonuclease [Clostridium sp.]|uniref:HNH endonuclease n=1 Tax=Clostridium sp. TaxID=1506 RepID=UPI003F2EDCD9
MTRETAIRDTLGVDVIDYYRLGKINQGERVHHIKELNEDYDKRFDVDNLIYLTEKNHRIVHREYNKGNKASMQELLLSLKLKFQEKFGLGGGSRKSLEQK